MLFVIALALTTYEIFSVNELRDSIQRANTSTLSLLLAEHATYRLGGSPLVIDGRLRVQISGREGTVVDAAGLSRAFIVAGGGSLELRSLSVIRGVANASDTDGGGGCVVVRPDSALRATDVLFSECAAVPPIGAWMDGCRRAYDGPQRPRRLQYPRRRGRRGHGCARRRDRIAWGHDLARGVARRHALWRYHTQAP